MGEDTDEWAWPMAYVSVVPIEFDFTAHHAIPVLKTNCSGMLKKSLTHSILAPYQHWFYQSLHLLLISRTESFIVASALKDYLAFPRLYFIVFALQLVFTHNDGQFAKQHFAVDGC